ncbi:MAG: hypothetical protein ACOYOV_07580 [Bacteroidales bacterium]
MKDIRNILIFVLLVAVFILATMRGCVRDNGSVVTITTHDTIPGDSIPVYTSVETPEPDTVWMDGEIVTLPADSSCVAEWLKLHGLYTGYAAYNDTLQDDSSALIVVIDTVHQNRLEGRSFGFQNRRLKIINTQITTTTINNGNGVFIGGGFLGSNPGGEFSIVKDRWMLDGGYYDKQIKVSAKFRLFKL